MAHQLSIRANSFAEMAYTGATPWHGLGQMVPAGASISEWQRQAGLDWHIHRSPVMFQNGSLHTVNDMVVLYRSDTNAPLSVVSSRYKEVQPAEMLGFFRDLVEDDGFTIETVGSLKGGRRLWALARTNLADTVGDSDLMRSYLLLCTSCDGSLATTAQFTSVRVVCQNTLHMAMRQEVSTDAKTRVSVRHTSKFDDQIVKGELGLSNRQAFATFMTRMRALQKREMTLTKAREFVTGLLNLDVAPTSAKSQGYRSILALFDGAGRGATLPGVAGTAWGLLNAVTEHVDHHARARSADNRLNSAWFGPGEALKRRTVDLLEAL